MKKAVTVLAAIALVLFTAFPATAYRGMGAPCGMRSFNYGPADAASNINLTAEQNEKINALREAHWKEIKPIKDQIFSKRGDLRTLWLAKEPDKEKILNLQREIQNLRGQMMEKATNHHLEMRKILTPEQLAKVQADRGMGRHMGRGGAGGNIIYGRAGMDRGGCCGGPGMRSGQPPCGAGMERPCGGAGMNCMSNRPGMGCGQSPCLKMR